MSDIATLRHMLNCCDTFCLPPIPYLSVLHKLAQEVSWFLLLLILLEYYCSLGLYIFPDYGMVLRRIKLKKNYF